MGLSGGVGCRQAGRQAGRSPGESRVTRCLWPTRIPNRLPVGRRHRPGKPPFERRRCHSPPPCLRTRGQQAGARSARAPHGAGLLAQWQAAAASPLCPACCNLLPLTLKLLICKHVHSSWLVLHAGGSRGRAAGAAALPRLRLWLLVSRPHAILPWRRRLGNRRSPWRWRCLLLLLQRGRWCSRLLLGVVAAVPRAVAAGVAGVWAAEGGSSRQGGTLVVLGRAAGGQTVPLRLLQPPAWCPAPQPPYRAVQRPWRC